jgi:hypothetical protein
MDMKKITVVKGEAIATEKMGNPLMIINSLAISVMLLMIVLAWRTEDAIKSHLFTCVAILIGIYSLKNISRKSLEK